MAYDHTLCQRVRSMFAELRCDAAERKMFGGVTFLVQGHMCCGVANRDLVLRLPDARVAELLSLRTEFVRPMDFTGKPMKSMLYVALDGVASDEPLQAWMKEAIAYAQALPPKPCR